jgi:hypothetical protein
MSVPLYTGLTVVLGFAYVSKYQLYKPGIETMVQACKALHQRSGYCGEETFVEITSFLKVPKLISLNKTFSIS